MTETIETYYKIEKNRKVSLTLRDADYLKLKIRCKDL